LPQHKTRSVLRSRSSPGGGGANELYLEDRRGEELIYLRAQRDLEQRVGHDSRLEVEGDSLTRVGQSLVIEAGQQVHLKAGASLVIEAGAQLSLKAGGEHLVMQAGSISSSQPITLGGSPSAHRSMNAGVQISAGQGVIMDLAKQLGADFCPLCECSREGLCDIAGRAA
jgi:type VI secretion system secreted protein VgrG